MPDWLEFAVAVLATWRLCRLVAHEDGPFDLIVRVRRAAGGGMWGRLMDCPYCLSLWFAVPFAVWLAQRWTDGVVLLLAISGGACLVEQLSAMLVARAKPTVIDLPPPAP